MVDEELIQVGQAPHPTDAEETWWRSGSDRCNDPAEVFARECCPSSFGEAAPHAGQDEPWCREVVVLAQHEVRSEITRRPRVEQGRCVGTKFIEQVGEQFSLDGVEERIVGHVAGV